jgi:DNA modification methylase
MGYNIQMLPIGAVTLNPDNPRTIKDSSFRRLVKSLQDAPRLFNARPLLCSDRTGKLIVLGGNMRLRAAIELKYGEVPVIIMQGLSEDQEREVAIKDNGAFGEWDYELLANEWSDLPLSDWGVDLPEDWKDVEPEETVDAEAQIDKAEELNKVWQVQPGDLWAIGEHRLLCGDSTKAEDVARVMGGVRPILMVTDPPYGINYDASWRNDAAAKGLIGQQKSTRAIGKIANDDRAEWGEVYKIADCDVLYVWHAGIKSNIVQDSIENAGYDVRAQIIWAKNNFAIGRGHYQPKHEPCFYAVKRGSAGAWVGGHSETTVWEIPKNLKNETGHATQKPLECMAIPIRNHESEYVYDPFLGSGTTMVACQNLSRKCRGIEISPAYCAVILERMKTAFPGLKIERVVHGA